MRKILVLAVACSTLVSLAETTITGVSARQRWPWNGLVDVVFTVGNAQTDNPFKVELRATYAGGTKEIAGHTYLDEPLVGPGTHRITWDLGADCPNFKANDLQISVVATQVPASSLDANDMYMVIDLSGGPTVTSYPVRYTTTPPTLVPTNDLVACAADPNRTTKLWLKRVKENTFPFGGTDTNGGEGIFKAHLSAYYIGVFELTQMQWALVMGNWPSVFTNTTYRAARPVSNINYEDVIGHNNWPANKVVSGTSFIGKMRARTGLSTLNLPTEAQWECACRAGYKKSRSGYVRRWSGNSGTVVDYNEGPDIGTALVGSYPANPWGFYDFYGNVMEMCLDAHASDADLQSLYDGQDPVDDPLGPPTVNATARFHATRGGSYYNSADYTNNNYSRYYNTHSRTGMRDSGIGLRIAMWAGWDE